MPVALPLIPTVPNYRVGCTLAGVPYVFDIRWNTRSEAWFMDIRTEDGTALRTSVKIVLGTFLGARSTDPDFPAGVFVAFDSSGADAEAGINDLGVRVQVHFWEADEFAELIE